LNAAITGFFAKNKEIVKKRNHEAKLEGRELYSELGFAGSSEAELLLLQLDTSKVTHYKFIGECNHHFHDLYGEQMIFALH